MLSMHVRLPSGQPFMLAAGSGGGGAAPTGEPATTGSIFFFLLFLAARQLQMGQLSLKLPQAPAFPLFFFAVCVHLRGHTRARPAWPPSLDRRRAGRV
jgi:hypothetical protein